MYIIIVFYIIGDVSQCSQLNNFKGKKILKEEERIVVYSSKVGSCLY